VKSGHIDGEDVFTETDYRNFTHKRALRTKDGWKYIMTLENGGEELFNLKADPAEKHNLFSEQKAKAGQLKDQLMKHLAALPVSTTGMSTGCLPAYPGQCDYK
jgi:hypothetical protein